MKKYLICGLRLASGRRGVDFFGFAPRLNAGLFIFCGGGYNGLIMDLINELGKSLKEIEISAGTFIPAAETLSHL